MGISDCEDLKVDILECENQRDKFHEEEEEEEEVLCEASSSSFGDSMCAHDDDDDGEEAQSMLNKDYPLSDIYDFSDSSKKKKKKLRDEWKRFSKPLMWRCKWLELKVKEIESRAKMYEKEVQSYYETKQLDFEISKSLDFEGKSIPFRHDQTQRMSLYKRGIRKHVEETTRTDLAAYMSNHNLFSYAEPKAMSKEDDFLVSKFDCSDEFLAKLLCEIDEAQGRARALKKRVDQVMINSETAQHTSSSMPRNVARCPEDSTVVQNSKECGLVEEPSTHIQREATVQIGRQRVSADHTEELSMLQDPPHEQFLNNNSPFSSGDGLRLESILEDVRVLMMLDQSEMEEEEEENLEYFKKLMDEITGVPLPSEETGDEEQEEDPKPVTKRHKTSSH
ncbi:unnamed protein product [Cochlearia groenlandica]